MKSKKGKAFSPSILYRCFFKLLSELRKATCSFLSSPPKGENSTLIRLIEKKRVRVWVYLYERACVKKRVCVWATESVWVWVYLYECECECVCVREREREYLVDISPIFDCLLLNWVKHGWKMERLKVCAKVFQRIKTKRTQRKKIRF